MQFEAKRKILYFCEIKENSSARHKRKYLFSNPFIALCGKMRSSSDRNERRFCETRQNKLLERSNATAIAGFRRR